MHDHSTVDYQQLTDNIKHWAYEIGFNKVGITDTDLSDYAQHLQTWVDQGYHGDMHYMTKHGSKRYEPETLVPGTQRVICVALNYLPPKTRFLNVMRNPFKAFISRYALGRDYHKVLRKKLKALAKRIQDECSDTQYRVFVDSAPVMEKALAEKAGLGWIGKHSNLLSEDGSSWFFLGELYTDLPLPIDEPVRDKCGSCSACMDICPTGAIVGPKQVDARRCISYLTIELKGPIPHQYRRLIGNRIYGCDDCQLICPWNKFAQATDDGDFEPRHGLDNADLIELFNWTEDEFLQKTQGSAIRRIGYHQWLRNLAIGLGNAPYSAQIITALRNQRPNLPEWLQEHIDWAIQEQYYKRRHIKLTPIPER